MFGLRKRPVRTGLFLVLKILDQQKTKTETAPWSLVGPDPEQSWSSPVQVFWWSQDWTFKHYSAIACVVCDLPAARKTAQLAGATSHFYCSACHCFHLSTLGRTDMDSETWSFQDKAELRGYAEQWRDAQSSTQRNKLFVKYGV